MAAALAYPNPQHPRGSVDPVLRPQPASIAHFARTTAQLLGIPESARLNIGPLLQAFHLVGHTPAVSRNQAAALFDLRVFEAWNHFVYGLLWQGIGWGGKDVVPPLVRELYQTGAAETAALHAFVLAGIAQPTTPTLTGLRVMALAGDWNEQRAAAVIHLLLISPDYWKQHLA